MDQGGELNDCPNGFRLTSPINSTAECADIDECATGVHTCRDDLEVCVNSHGTFQCQPRESNPLTRMVCPHGFRFHRFTFECEDINECQSGQHECHLATEKCVNTLGSYRCEAKVNKAQALSLVSCPQGFEFNDTSGRCDDIDECRDSGWKQVCPPNAVCHNTMATYQCLCEVDDHLFVVRECR